jgi:hypothetical protein
MFVIPIYRIHPVIAWPFRIGLIFLMLCSVVSVVTYCIHYYTTPTSPPAHHRTHKPAASHPAQTNN